MNDDDDDDELLDQLTAVIYTLGERMSFDELKEKIQDAVDLALDDVKSEQE